MQENQAPVISQPVSTQPEVPVQSQDPTPVPNPEVKPKRNKSIILILTIVVLLGVSGYFVYQNYQLKNKVTPTKSIQSSNKISDFSTTTPDPTTNLETYALELAGFLIQKPLNWSLETSIRSNDSFSGKFIPDASGNNRSSYIEIVIDEKAEINNNPLWAISDETKKSGYILKTGKETFSGSERLILQAEITKGSKIAQLTLVGPEDFVKENKMLLEWISQSAIPQQSLRLLPRLITQAYAQESASPTSEINSIETETIASFSVNDFKVVKIGADPYPENLSSQDNVYKDGYARLYKFDFIKGTRLESLAEENLDGVGSFIETELYNYDGSLISSGQTRISLSKDQRSHLIDNQTLFLVVKSFDQKQGQFALHILDKNQTEKLHYVMYSDGTEYLLNDENHGFSKPKSSIMKVIYNGNVEIIQPNKVRYIVKALSCIYCSALKRDITEEIIITDSSGTKVPLKLTKLFTNQVLIQPDNKESFKTGESYQFSSSYKIEEGVGGGYSTRFGTK